MQPNHDVEELFELAYKDDLTGLYNRRYFNRVISKSLEDASQDTSYCLCMMDIDYFKEINDTYGHKNGDQALISLARLLRESFRDEETPVRFAGDEFIVFLPGMGLEKGLEKAQELVERGSGLVIPVEGDRKDIRFTLSVGVADFPDHGNHWEEVLERADQALYLAKQGGRNRAAVPEEEGVEIQRGDDLSRIFPCPDYIGGSGPLRKVLDAMDTLVLPQGSDPFYLSCTGGRGSGKTRLLQEVGKAATERNIPFLHLTGTEQLQDVCYGSLVRGLLRHAGSADTLREQAAGETEPEDEELWQAFFSPKSGERNPLEAGLPHRFFERLLRGIAGPDRTLVLLVDDAECLDPETLELLRQLRSSEDPGFRCFSVLTETRDTAQPSTPGTDGMEAVSDSGPNRFPAKPATDSEEIPPLTPEGVNGMVQSIFPTLRVTPSFFKDLAARGRGNPLYVEEELKLLIQRKILVYRRSAWNWQVDMFGDLPESLDSLLEARLDSLDPDVRGLLEKASVMGPDIDPELLKEIGGENEGYILDLLEKARKSGILHTDARWQTEAFHFNAKEARALSYDRLPEEDRMAWHLELARLHRAMEGGPEHLSLGPLQHHYRMAGEEKEFLEIRDRLSQISPATSIPVPQWAGSRRRKETIEEPVALSQQNLAGVLSIFHLLRAAVQTWRLYPETSQAVSQACERLQEGFQQTFEHAPSVHLSEADGTLLVNGEALAWKGEEKKVADTFCSTLSAAGLKDIAFLRGLSLEEIKTFLRTWVQVQQETSDAPSRWEAFETGEGIEHVQVNAKVYVAVSETALFPGGDVTFVRQQESGESPDETTDLLDSLQARIASLQIPGKGDRTDPEDAERTRTLLEKVYAFLQAGNSGETATGTMQAPSDTQDPLSRESGSLAETSGPVLEKIQEDDVRCALADILSGDPRREARGYRKISESGEQAVESLYFSLTQTEDAHEGRLCARFLASLSPGFTDRLLADLNRPTDPSMKKRILQYAVPVLEGSEPRKKILSSALESENREVAMEALHQVETSLSEEAAPVLLSALQRCPGRTRMEIYACLGRMGDTTCVPQLLQSLDAWKTNQDEKGIRELESTCDALGHFNDPGIVEKLGELLASRSRLPWRKSVPGNLRKAALKTLLRIGGAPVTAILQRHESDRDPWIRLRSKQFLQEQGQA